MTEQLYYISVYLKIPAFFTAGYLLPGAAGDASNVTRTVPMSQELSPCSTPMSPKEPGKSENFSYLFITHGMSVVKYISDRIGVMYFGHLVEEASTEEFFSNTFHPYSKALLSAVPDAAVHTKSVSD